MPPAAPCADAGPDRDRVLAALGLLPPPEDAASWRPAEVDGAYGEVSRLEMHSVRPLRRVGPDGQILSAVVIEITQRWRPSVPPGRRTGWCAAAAPHLGPLRPGGALHRLQAGRPAPAGGGAAGAAPGADRIRLDLRQLPAPGSPAAGALRADAFGRVRRPAMAARKPAARPAGRAPEGRRGEAEVARKAPPGRRPRRRRRRC